SGGQQQRVTIARSLANHPKILLADEPTGNLDSKSSIEILKLFRTLNTENGQAIVMVTHDPEIGKMTDRIIYFRDGKIVSKSG
ncbi:MAG: ATP-binding cassette domain-containing protein, partial [Methanosarcinales archaeon]